MKAKELREEFGAKNTGYTPFLTLYAKWLEQKLIDHQAKSKEEAVDITNKVETLIGYLELWYRRYSPPSGFFAVIEEAKEWLAAFGKEGEDFPSLDDSLAKRMPDYKRKTGKEDK